MWLTRQFLQLARIGLKPSEKTCYSRWFPGRLKIFELGSVEDVWTWPKATTLQRGEGFIHKREQRLWPVFNPVAESPVDYPGGK